MSPSPAQPAPHLLVPHASGISAAAQAALQVLKLPRLEALLERLTETGAPGPAPSSHAAHASRPGTATEHDEADEYSLSAPHEHVLAQLHGWQGGDGRWPWAAALAAADGIGDGGDPHTAWGLVTPVHWQVGSDQISLLDPALLELGADESRALFEALLPSFEAEGWRLIWGAPLRWYARHDSLAGLRTASLDRAIGRSLDLWLSDDLQARRLRRLQVEAQMLWHEHPVNEARDAAHQWRVNSFWLSGCGAAQPARPPTGLRVDDRLRAPLLAGEWEAWVAAWAELDAGPIAELRAAADRGEALQLTLCGERHARSWQTAPRGLLQRWFGPKRHDALPVLTEL